MVITNRNGFYHDSMFNEMEQFAQHQIKLNHWRQVAKLYKDDEVVANLEDLRGVFNVPGGDIQFKCRVTKTHIDKLNKEDAVTIKIESKGALKEPTSTYKVEEWFEPLMGLVKDIEKNTEVYVTENKWLYLRARMV